MASKAKLVARVAALKEALARWCWCFRKEARVAKKRARVARAKAELAAGKAQAKRKRKEVAEAERQLASAEARCKVLQNEVEELKGAADGLTSGGGAYPVADCVRKPAVLINRTITRPPFKTR